MPALKQGESGSTEAVYTLFLKTVPFIKVQPGGMILQQCPISRGKNVHTPSLELNIEQWSWKELSCQGGNTFINQMAQEALDSFPQKGCTCTLEGTVCRVPGIMGDLRTSQGLFPQAGLLRTESKFPASLSLFAYTQQKPSRRDLTCSFRVSPISLYYLTNHVAFFWSEWVFRFTVE